MERLFGKCVTGHAGAVFWPPPGRNQTNNSCYERFEPRLGLPSAAANDQKKYEFRAEDHDRSWISVDVASLGGRSSNGGTAIDFQIPGRNQGDPFSSLTGTKLEPARNNEASWKTNLAHDQGALRVPFRSSFTKGYPRAPKKHCYFSDSYYVTAGELCSAYVLLGTD